MINEIGKHVEVANHVTDERVDFDVLYMVLVVFGRGGALGLYGGVPAELWRRNLREYAHLFAKLIQSRIQWNCICCIDFVCFCARVLDARPTAHKLSHSISVVGCG